MNEQDPEESPFEGADFLENPEPRCPCVLLLETGDAEVAGALREVEAGLLALHRDLAADDLAKKRVELAVVTYGPVRVVRDFAVLDDAGLPGLEPGRAAPLGEAIETAVEMIDERKAAYRAAGIAHYRPWILCLSSGRATDSWENAAELVRAGEARGSFTFRAIALAGASTDVLSLLSEREVRRLDGLRFRELFTWLGQSLGAVSRSAPGSEIELPEPWDWALVVP